MKVIVDTWGERVKPWATVMGRDGAYYTVTDLAPQDKFQVGAVFEGGCADDDGDFFTADFFDLKIIDL